MRPTQQLQIDPDPWGASSHVAGPHGVRDPLESGVYDDDQERVYQADDVCQQASCWAGESLWALPDGAFRLAYYLSTIAISEDRVTVANPQTGRPMIVRRGQVIFTIRLLSAALHRSRNTIRKAIGHLLSVGFLTPTPSAFVYNVNDNIRRMPSETMEWVLCGALAMGRN